MYSCRRLSSLARSAIDAPGAAGTSCSLADLPGRPRLCPPPLAADAAAAAAAGVGAGAANLEPRGPALPREGSG
jgi:hypothetical protein